MRSQLTIAIPVYERVEYFEEALRSALNQTVPCEVLVVDNASKTDFFRLLCERFASRVTYHRQASNVGMFANWNSCVRLTNTPYVTVLGDDDILHMEYAEKVLKAWDTWPNARFVFTKFRYVGQGIAALPEPIWPPFGRSTLRGIKQMAARKGLGFPAVSTCHLTEALMAKPWREQPHGSSDWAHIYTLPDDWVCVGLDEIMLDYRKHPGADTANVKTALLCAISHAWIQRNLAALHWRAYMRFWIKLLHVYSMSFAGNTADSQVLKGNFYLNSLLKDYSDSGVVRFVFGGSGRGAALTFASLYRQYLYAKGVRIRHHGRDPII